MKPRPIKPSLFVAILICLVLWGFLAMTFFMRTLVRIEDTSVEHSLATTATSNAAQVRFLFERYTNALQTTAMALERFGDFTSPEALDYLSRVAKVEGYARLAVDFSNGFSYTSDGSILDISALNYADRIPLGEIFILDVQPALTDGTPLVSVLLPLRNQSGESVAALRCAFSTQTLSALFDRTFSRADGYYHLVDGNGNYIAVSNSENALLMDRSFFNALDALEYDPGYSAQMIKDTFSKQKEGFSKYSYEGNARYAYYLPVGINDWVLMMIAPKEVLESRTVQHQQNSMILSAQIAILFTIVLLLVYFTQEKSKKSALLQEKCFRVLAEQTGKIIFEWNFSLNRISCLSNFKTIFGRDMLTTHSFQEALSGGVIHEDDRQVFESIFHTILAGHPVSDVRFRILDGQGHYRWTSLSGLVVDDQHKKPFKAIGTLEDIDDQIRKEHDLRKKAEIDALTSLYNRATTESLIRDSLALWQEGDAPCALMIIDVDNFKSVNDSFGHLYGDIVLSSLAESLRRIFRANDIIGRIGGDEFFVFLKHFASPELLSVKANEILRQFRNHYNENGISVQISASIGIALCPDHGNDFDRLYHHTDIALYTAKAQGKNRYCIFDGQGNPEYHATRTDFDTQGFIQKSFKENRIEYIFKLLYESEDPIVAISSILKLITIHFNFSHSYIFEKDLSGDSISSTFFWHAQDLCDDNQMFQTIPLSRCTPFYASLSKTGRFILHADSNDDETMMMRDQLQRRGIRAMLQFAIMERGDLTGAIRFDAEQEHRHFTPGEIDELSTICHVLATFLSKQRSLERQHAHHLNVEAILDNMDSYAYVIDRENHDILYENKNVFTLVDGISVGKKCYAAYQGKSAPCDSCPLDLLSEHCKRCVAEVPNKKYELVLRATATAIDWSNGQKACLIHCVDITEYKQTHTD